MLRTATEIGSADTVRTELVRQVSESGVNYLSGTFAFGDLTLDEVSNSVRLFSSVMPAVRTAYDAVRRKHEA